MSTVRKHKTALLERAVQIITRGSYGLISTHRVSAKGVSILRDRLQSLGIQSKVIPSGLYKVATHKETFRGSTLLVWADAVSLVTGVMKARYQEQRYLNQGQVCDSDLVVTKGLTNLKLGGNLNLLQGVLSVKPQKGFIQITEDKVLVRKGQVVTAHMSRLARVLRIPSPGIGCVVRYLQVQSEPIPVPWLEVVNKPLAPDRPQDRLSTLLQSWSARINQGVLLLGDKYRESDQGI